MKIALFSYEYPPDTAHGGVATCAFHTARMMAERGHHVEVFAGSYKRNQSTQAQGVTVHRLKHTDHGTFQDAIIPAFTQRQAAVGFDVIESPELEAEGWGVMRQSPQVARVVKLHCPNELIRQATHGQYDPPKPLERIRLHLDSAIHGQKPYWAGSGRPVTASPQSQRLEEAERELACAADVVITPSRHLGQRVVDTWGIDPSVIHRVPNVLVPDQQTLAIPFDTQTRVVTYIGRLEPLKGVFDLARAIPLIRRGQPDAGFRLIGESQDTGVFGDMRLYLQRTLLRRASGYVEMTGAVPRDRISHYLSEAEVCVFPSIMDNFPYVCLEAMAAGRAVVGTLDTGMQEMIEDGRTGRLVPQQAPERIAQAVLDLMQDRERRIAIGAAARRHVTRAYSTDTLGPLQELAYEEALARRDSRLSQQKAKV